MRSKNDIYKLVIDWTPASSVSCADTFPDGEGFFIFQKPAGEAGCLIYILRFERIVRQRYTVCQNVF